ncbi:MAG: glycosyltransferase family 2 protein [Terrimicrobiaceae bacterium]|nr:glycosyltransferase family 2 protein [Terrimicrobiaceae bacterium]
MAASEPAPILTVLCPCYREEANLAEMHRRVTAVCAGLGVSYEIVLVDDGSPDATWREICRLAKSDPHVAGLRLTRNYGHQLAVTAGLARARGQRILILDADLQDPPELLPEMMRLMDAGADNVYGQRVSRAGVPIWKKACYKIFYRVLAFLAGCEIPPDAGDFRLISRRVADAVNAMPEQHRFLRGMMSWTGFRQAPVRYHREPRFAGKSGYTLAKLVRFAVDGITSFSITPLRVATLLGFATGFLALGAGLYVIVATLVLGRPVPGWASLMVAILFVGSLQLFVLGIIGEYLGRLFLEAKGRPLYLVAEEVGAGCPEPPTAMGGPSL